MEVVKRLQVGTEARLAGVETVLQEVDRLERAGVRRTVVLEEEDWEI